jgi:hypothetical protein
MSKSNFLDARRRKFLESEPAKQAMAAASDMDRIFFELNPTRNYHLRPPILNEFPPDDIVKSFPGEIETFFVVVCQITRGVRSRILTSSPGTPDIYESDEEEFAKALWEGIIEGNGYAVLPS